MEEEKEKGIMVNNEKYEREREGIGGEFGKF